MKREIKKAALTMYLNEDANGFIYVSSKPMNKRYYYTPAILKCIETKAKKITRSGVFAGAICATIDGRILKIVEVENRQGFERDYIKVGNIHETPH